MVYLTGRLDLSAQDTSFTLLSGKKVDYVSHDCIVMLNNTRDTLTFGLKTSLAAPYQSYRLLPRDNQAYYLKRYAFSFYCEICTGKKCKYYQLDGGRKYKIEWNNKELLWDIFLNGE